MNFDGANINRGFGFTSFFGNYFSSTISTSDVNHVVNLEISSSVNQTQDSYRSYGGGMRCIRD